MHALASFETCRRCFWEAALHSFQYSFQLLGSPQLHNTAPDECLAVAAQMLLELADPAHQHST
jgi:hypothetical protein